MTKPSPTLKDGQTSAKPEVKKTDGAEPTPKPESDGETGGPKGPEPTRFGDWEQKGRCSDF